MQAQSTSLSTKINNLWTSNKPLCIAIVAVISLIFLGSIATLLYFTVFKPKGAASREVTTVQSKNTTPIVAPSTSTNTTSSTSSTSTAPTASTTTNTTTSGTTTPKHHHLGLRRVNKHF